MSRYTIQEIRNELDIANVYRTFGASENSVNFLTEFINYLLNNYNNYYILYDLDTFKDKFNWWLVKHCYNINRYQKAFFIQFNDQFENIENWFSDTSSESKFETGNQGFNTQGVFRNDKTTTSSKYKDPLSFMNKFKVYIDDLWFAMCSDFEQLLQTIY